MFNTLDFFVMALASGALIGLYLFIALLGGNWVGGTRLPTLTRPTLLLAKSLQHFSTVGAVLPSLIAGASVGSAVDRAVLGNNRCLILSPGGSYDSK